jgi:hypothetical protein
MDEGVIDDPAVVSLLHALARDSYDLQSVVDDFTSSLDASAAHSSDDLMAIAAKYTHLMARFDSATRQCESLLAAVGSAPPAPGPAPAPPPVPHTRFVPPMRMLDVFLARAVPLAAPPYPPLCGALPLAPGAPLPLASFVAAKIEADWTLCYIAAEDPEGYLICDAESLGDDAATTRVRPEMVAPLPTFLPDRKCPECEFAPGTQVLALWPEEGIWTSVFYRATVVKTPTESGNSYKLAFDGAKRGIHVPQHFVIAFRE